MDGQEELEVYCCMILTLQIKQYNIQKKKQL